MGENIKQHNGLSWAFLRSILSAFRLLGLITFCLGSSVLAGPGFNTVRSDDLPDAVKALAGSVFQAIYPVPPFKIYDLGTQEMQAFQEFDPGLYKGNPKQPPTVPSKGFACTFSFRGFVLAAFLPPESRPTAPCLVDQWRLNQFLLCKLNNIRMCPISEEAGIGSAFLVGDHSTVATHFDHILPWLKLAYIKNQERFSDLKEIPLPILFQNNNGFIVKPITENIYLSFYNTDSRLILGDGPERSLLRIMSSYVELRLPHPLSKADLGEIGQGKEKEAATPLQYATEDQPTGYNLFSLGWAGATANRPPYGDNSSGKEVQISYGPSDSPVTSTNEATAFYQRNFLWAFPADYHIRNRGGPIVDREGSLYGIVFNGKVEETTVPASNGKNVKRFQVRTDGLKTNKKVLLQVWNKFMERKATH